MALSYFYRKAPSFNKSINFAPSAPDARLLKRYVVIREISNVAEKNRIIFEGDMLYFYRFLPDGYHFCLFDGYKSGLYFGVE